MNPKNKMRYTRNLGITPILSVLALGLVLTALGCGFVHMRTLRVTNGDHKGTLEREIASLEKQIQTLGLRFEESIEREALAMRLRMEGSRLVQIGNDFRVLRHSAVERVAMRSEPVHEFQP